MSNSVLKRKAAPLTHNEYCILANVHRHLSDAGPLPSTLKDATPLKRLAMATGVDTSTAREAIRMVKKRESPPDRPRRDIQTTHEIVAAIRQVIRKRQNDDDVVGVITFSRLLQELASRHNIVLEERTLQRYLRRLNYHIGQSVLKPLTFVFESQRIIDYRNLYVQDRLTNLNCFALPVKPEVYVDESFWSLDQNSRPFRVSEGIGLNRRGPEPLLVVFGAIVISSKQNQVSSKFVRKSVLIWPMRGIAEDLDGSIPSNEELWRSVPKTVQTAGIATDFQDHHLYYADLEDDIWEAMFEALCQTLYKDYGSCHIHMDGAAPHMRRENMLPYARNTREEVKEWFIKNKLPIPTGNKGRPLSIPELVVRAREANVPPQYASETIASKHKHTILRIPRHHYEFQPMEKVWRMGNMSTTPISGNTEPELKLRNRLLEVFASLTEAHLFRYWWETHLAALEYHHVYREQREIGQVSQGETDSEWSDEGI
ncbi:hypothetical protein BGZ68_007804 [Mortierella alpina]|nr:hypothetical protein BGZ68_007804 [Mortierella alpina]